MKIFQFVIVCLLFSQSANADISSQVSTNYFLFNADSIAQLVKSIKKSGPKVGNRSAWATLKWDLYTEYSFKTQNNGCNIKINEMEIVAEITLPKWQNINSQADWIQQWWTKYSKFISEHENSHLLNVRDSAKKFKAKLLAMPTQESCSNVKQQYLKLKYDYMEMVNRLDQNIDREAKLRFYRKEDLFAPLNKDVSVVFESGMMNSYIGL